MTTLALTAPFNSVQTLIEHVPLKSEKTAYTGMVYHFNYGSMATSYLDLPGHIAETDDGCCAVKLDPGEWYRQPAGLIRITARPGAEFAIRPEDVERAMEGRTWHPWMVLHALGGRTDSEKPIRMTYLAMETVDLLIAKGVKVMLGDAWESRRLEGVFLRLFGRGVSTVCNLVNLDKLPDDREFRITLGFLPYAGSVTQIPCSVLAEFEE